MEIRLVVETGPASGRVILVDREFGLGRLDGNDVVLEDARVSGRHARLRPAPEGAELIDLDSTNGTFVNGERITAPVVLRGGESVLIGSTSLRVEAPGPATTTDAQPVEWRLSVRTGADLGRTAELRDGDEIVIGRGEDSGLTLEDARVSNRHARVRRKGAGITVEDLGSANGTLVDGRPLRRGPRPLRSGAEIQVGETVIVVSSGSPGGSRIGPAPTVIGSVPSEFRASARSSRRILVLVAGLAVLAVAAAAAALAFRGGDDETAAPAALTTSEIVRKNSDATVHILNVISPEASGAGSGSVIDLDDGLVLTNNHVVAGAEELSVRNDALGRNVPAELVAAMPCEDLALIRVSDPADRKGMRAVLLGDSSELEQGDAVVALGFPASAESGRNFSADTLSATDGIVSKIETTYDVPASGVPLLGSVIQHTAAVNFGNSGGPLFDGRGNQVGINTAIFGIGGQRAEGENYAISAARIRGKLPALREGRSAAWIGVSLGETLTDRQTGDPAAVRIDGVSPGSPAEEAGITEGLVLVAVDGQPVFDLQGYCEHVPEAPGEPVSLDLVDLETQEQGTASLTTG